MPGGVLYTSPGRFSLTGWNSTHADRLRPPVPDHLVGQAEIADLLGVTPQRVAQLARDYDDFPAPEVELAQGRVWSRQAIEEWMAKHPERRPGRPRKGG